MSATAMCAVVGAAGTPPALRVVEPEANVVASASPSGRTATLEISAFGKTAISLSGLARRKIDGKNAVLLVECFPGAEIDGRAVRRQGEVGLYREPRPEIGRLCASIEFNESADSGGPQVDSHKHRAAAVDAADQKRRTVVIPTRASRPRHSTQGVGLVGVVSREWTTTSGPVTEAMRLPSGDHAGVPDLLPSALGTPADRPLPTSSRSVRG